MSKAQVVIVTGLSGSGKSTAIKALEDLGFFCIDNLPVVILDKFLLLADQHPQVGRVALGIDARERSFLGSFAEAIDGVKALGHAVDVIFLDAADDVLIRRFSETRRRHPLEPEAGSVAEGIARERVVLAPLRERATWLVDTSRHTVHQLKSLVQQAYDPSRARMGLHLVSFGFKHGAPHEADYVFDCRLLPNPYFVEGLRPKSGTDPEVRAFLESRPEWPGLCDRVGDLLEWAIPLHEGEGKPVLTVAFGCTGGRHRSVAMAEALAARLREKGHAVRLVHRDMAAEGET
jgi:UPF0042 nucleotide-binding protein